VIHSTSADTAIPHTLRAPVQRPFARIAAGRTGAQRLAALLTAISRNNVHEGRDPTLVPDTLSCGFVADLLGVALAQLAELLAALEHLGLVARTPDGGLRLMDLHALDSLADAH
jgi:hypothetical protein